MTSQAPPAASQTRTVPVPAAPPAAEALAPAASTPRLLLRLAYRWRDVPIRWKLTTQYALLMVGVFVLFSAALFFGLRFQLYNLLDQQIRDQAEVTLANIRFDAGQLALQPVVEEDGENDEKFVRLLDTNRSVVSAVGVLPRDDQLGPGVVNSALRGRTVFSTIELDDDEVRVISTPVRANGAVVGVLQLGQERDHIDEDLLELLSVLLLALPGVLALALAGGYILAGRALAPVAEITDRAAAIEAKDLHARLNLPLPDDELGRLARTFDAMLGRIEDAFERQRRFTGDAAHELRTPLSLMRSQVDHALARPRSPEEYQSALHDLEGDLERLTGLVGTLLELARSDTGTLKLDRSRFDLAVTIDLVREQFAQAAEEAGVALISETQPCFVEADEDRLVQVQVNLVANALAHTPSGGTVTLGCIPNGAGARFWVVDNGVGITPEHLGRIFDRFYRVDTGRARAVGGTGLGLSISRAIVEAHGGTITARSVPGNGARFDVTIY